MLWHPMSALVSQIVFLLVMASYMKNQTVYIDVWFPQISLECQESMLTLFSAGLGEKGRRKMTCSINWQQISLQRNLPAGHEACLHMLPSEWTFTIFQIMSLGVTTSFTDIIWFVNTCYFVTTLLFSVWKMRTESSVWKKKSPKLTYGKWTKVVDPMLGIFLALMWPIRQCGVAQRNGLFSFITLYPFVFQNNLKWIAS